MTVGYLPHDFDLFNVEHLDLIASAAARCEKLVVGVLDDEAVLLRTGRLPVVPLDERVEILSNVRQVDEVVVHAPGSDLSGVTVFVSLGEVDEWPGSVHVLPAVRTSSSQLLRQASGPASVEAAV